MVRLFAEKARTFSAAVPDDYEDGHEHEIDFDRNAVDQRNLDAHNHDGLAEEESRNLLETEFRELVRDLNVDEAATLVAIAWLGRGDYDASELSQAIADARPRVNRHLASYLLGLPMLADWLEDGLEAIGA